MKIILLILVISLPLACAHAPTDQAASQEAEHAGTAAETAENATLDEAEAVEPVHSAEQQGPLETLFWLSVMTLLVILPFWPFLV